MTLASKTRICAAVIALAGSFALSACSGGGGAPGSHVLPQATGANGGVASLGAVRSGLTRIESSDKQNSQARTAKDFTQPSNTMTADPPVPHPNEQPCAVQLFSNFQFTNFTYPTFQYTPPAACPGPWAKVVFEGDFSVNAGRQFDRTGSVWIAGTSFYFGTTAEPSANRAPSWHVERDVTDLSAVLGAPSTGEVVLGNIVNSTYTGIITASGKLDFYPANTTFPAPVVPDNVYPLSGGTLGDNQYISTQQQPLTGTFTLPRNVRAAYLDVYLQSQIGDEFWYTCFPNDLAQQIPNCGNTAFREGEVAIDGQAAGVAPVYPWIFTGGLDPYLWRPIPGVETLEFKPYRVNLTPFAALLSDGNPHTVTVNVFNNGNYFAANGTLLVYQDHGSSTVSGGIISDNTVLYPSPQVKENVTFNKQGIGEGTVSVTATHPVSIDGYVNTSAGRVETRVDQQISFANVQQITANPSETIFDQSIKQDTSVISQTTTIYATGTRQMVQEEKHWPLAVVYDFIVNTDGSATQNASISQAKIERSITTGNNQTRPLRIFLSNSVKSSDVLTFFSTGGYAPSNGKSTQTYIQSSSDGYCYNKTISSVNYVLTGQTSGPCPF